MQGYWVAKVDGIVVARGPTAEDAMYNAESAGANKDDVILEFMYETPRI